ncbi:MAG TPA: CsgG/HfaB family protein [Armatimonadota bacterium]|jgi:curli biogenesis system outer membrane secretion channel CsgG
MKTLWLLGVTLALFCFSSLCRAADVASTFAEAANVLAQQICDGREAAALQGETVAITQFQDKTGEGVNAGLCQDRLITAFVKRHWFRLVERERLDKSMQELKLSSSGLVTPESQKRLGRLLGATYLLVGAISTGLTGDGYSISARLVQVDTGEIVASADYLQPVEAKKLRIMIVVPEVHIGRRAPDPAGETELIKMFTEAGCRVVDQSQYAAIRDTPDMEEAIKDPTGVQARNLIAKYGADILIVGEAFSERAEGGTRGLISCRARVEVRAVTTRGDARILAACDGVESAMDTAELIAGKSALRKAGHVAGSYLLKRLVGGDAHGDPTPSAEPRKPTIAIAPFANRSRWQAAEWKLEQQIPDLITVSLVANRNLAVIDRASVEQTVGLQTDQLGGLYDNMGKSTELGTLLKADYLLVGRITEYGSEKNNIGLGGLKLNTEKATVKLLIKVIDVAKGTVVTATEADADETSGISLRGGDADGVRFGSAEFDRTALGKATRKAITTAVNAVQDGMGVGAMCPHCNAAVKAGSKFCPSCGKKLDNTPATCAKCHSKLGAGDKFCPNCGTPTGATTPEAR